VADLFRDTYAELTERQAQQFKEYLVSATRTAG
jgi:hypothetical protein